MVNIYTYTQYMHNTYLHINMYLCVVMCTYAVWAICSFSIAYNNNHDDNNHNKIDIVYSIQ